MLGCKLNLGILLCARAFIHEDGIYYLAYNECEKCAGGKEIFRIENIRDIY